MITFIKIGATWCQPCAAMEPVMAELVSRYAQDDKLEIRQSDVDQEPELAASWSVRSIPCVIVVDQQVAVWRKVGYVECNEIAEVIEKLKLTEL